jgi:HEAT repeat protein
VQQFRQVTCFVVFVLAAVLPAAAGPWQMEGGRAPSPKTERELIAVLHSNAPKAKKADACKDLAVYGSSEAVPELAGLLSDEQLASWARIALEAIPGSAADRALREALNTLHGELLIGAIDSVAVRRDAVAVVPLTGHLWAQNAAVASAAAAALGHIGNAAATKALEQSLALGPAKVHSAVAEGLVLCAERSAAEGRDAQAVAIYDEVRKADVPKQRILEATRGAILARKQDGIALLLEQFRSADKHMFQMALGTSRQFPGRQVDEALAAEVDRATPERAALLIEAMADRKEGVVLSAVLKAAGHGPRQVRIAAVNAIGRVGNASCLSLLLDTALESDADLAQAAKAALASLPAKDVDKDIVARLQGAQGKIYPLLIELVGERRIHAVADLVKALDNSDDTVRSAAWTALGTTVSADKLSILISEVVAPKHSEDASIAERALKTASVRMADRERCAQELAKAMEQAPTPKKIVLLRILGAVGGTKALATIGAAAKDTDPQLQDASTRLLGTWMTVDAAPVLLDLAKTSPSERFRVRALRSYIAIARRFAMPEQERCAMCEKALAAATQLAEQKLVLDVLALKRYRNLETLRLAAKLTRDLPKLNNEATQAALTIARELGDEKHSATADEARDILSHAKLHKVKLEIVKAEYGAAGKEKDVAKTLQKQVDGVQLIKLPSPSYTASFGGDPAPGTPKKLKIQYRIDGKAGDESFAENALVILPMPK